MTRTLFWNPKYILNKRHQGRMEMYKKGDRVVNGFTPYIHTLPKYIFKGNTQKIRYTTPVLKRRRSTTLTESKEGGCWRRNKRIFRTQRVHPQSTSSISLAWSSPKQCYLCLESSFIGQKSCTLWIQTRVRDNSSHHEDANGYLWTRESEVWWGHAEGSVSKFCSSLDSDLKCTVYFLITEIQVLWYPLSSYGNPGY